MSAVTRRIALALTATALAVGSLTSPAAAITDGELDGNGHPHVGIMVAKDASGKPLWRCTGTLLTTTLFLTAGHCTESPAASADIWFRADMTDAKANNYPNKGDARGTTYTHPEYNPGNFTYRDVGVVRLDRPYKGTNGQFGALPTLNQLDSLKTTKNSVTFTAVGYGLQESFPEAASWKDSALRLRLVAYPKLDQINVPGFTGDYSLLLSNNASTGGTCFGDSGGPNFLGDSNVVAGVTSFGINGNCAGTGGVFRMDRSWALDWVRSFMK